jgi:hypothetical protein
MKLVLNFSIGDGCTYFCDVTLPIEYESSEQAIVDLEAVSLKAHAEREYFFTFAGHEIETAAFMIREESGKLIRVKFCPPSILMIVLSGSLKTISNKRST